MCCCWPCSEIGSGCGSLVEIGPAVSPDPPVHLIRLEHDGYGRSYGDGGDDDDEHYDCDGHALSQIHRVESRKMRRR